MQILFHKLSDKRHALEIVRPEGLRERVECETRSCLVHDFLHFLVEEGANLWSGFWGNLSDGDTLADMNDRTGRSMAERRPAMMEIERIVGVLDMAAKGRTPADVVATIAGYLGALDVQMPPWLTEELVAHVQKHLRSLLGRWKSTPYGGSLELEWTLGTRRSTFRPLR